MLGKWLARRTPALERPDRRGACRHLRRQFVFAGVGLQFLELQLHLFEKPGLALRAAAMDVALQLLDLQSEPGDQRIRM